MDNNNVWLLCFGMAGGLLRHLKEKTKAGGSGIWRRVTTYRDIVLELGTSAFVTYAIYSLCIGLGWEHGVAVAFGGMAGYLGGSAVDLMVRVFEGRAR